MNRSTLLTALVTGSALAGAGYLLRRRQSPRALPSSIVPIITPVIDFAVADPEQRLAVAAVLAEFPGVIEHPEVACSATPLKFAWVRAAVAKGEHRALDLRVRLVDVPARVPIRRS